MNRTRISYATHTSNPIRARRKDNGKVGHYCTKCLPGCANCYAETINMRFGTGLRFTPENADKIEFFLDDAELDRIRRRRKPATVFLSDMTDWMHPGADKIWYQMLDVIEGVKTCTFLTLTKRIEHLAYLLPDDYPAPYGNVYHGVTVCNQVEANVKIWPHLMNVPGKRWISIEPMLSAIKLPQSVMAGFVDFVAIGTESGPKRRPCELEWIKSIIEQCDAAGVPVHVKQIPVPAIPKAEWAEFIAGRPNASPGFIDMINTTAGSRVSRDPLEWPAWARRRDMIGRSGEQRE